MSNKRIAFRLMLMLVVAGVVLAAPLGRSAAAPKPPGGPGASCNILLNVSFRDAEGDAVRSDGLGTYFDGSEQVTAQIDCGDDFRMLTGNRAWGIDLDAVSSDLVNAEGNLGVEVGIPGGLDTMEPGATLQSTKVRFNFWVGSSRYTLIFQKSQFPLTHDIDVTRVDENTWVVEAPADAVANLQTCPLRGKCSAPVNQTVNAPFRMTLTRQ